MLSVILHCNKCSQRGRTIQGRLCFRNEKLEDVPSALGSLLSFAAGTKPRARAASRMFFSTSAVPHLAGKRRVVRRSAHASSSPFNNVGASPQTMINYSRPPPLIRSAPHPPPKHGVLREYALPVALIATSIGLFIYFYTHNHNDNFEFWDAMQSGKELPSSSFEGVADDDDDFEDFDEEDDEET